MPSASPPPLSGKQLVFVFMAATVVAVVIFLCGVMVGRGVPARAGGRAIDAPIDPTASVVRRRPAVPRAPGELAPSINEDLSYPDRLEAPEVLREPMFTRPGRTRGTRAPAAAAPMRQASADSPARDGVAVIVASYYERTMADVVADRLAARGYPSYVHDGALGGESRYWVHVGNYQSRREAEAVRVRLEREEQFRPVLATP